jgi:hypothetical protein
VSIKIINLFSFGIPFSHILIAYGLSAQILRIKKRKKEQKFKLLVLKYFREFGRHDRKKEVLNDRNDIEKT